MSQDPHTFNANLEFVAAHLMIDLAAVTGSHSSGNTVSDEELAILAEPNAAQRLGSERVEQIMLQIASDSRLFEQWHMLAESRVLDGEFIGANVSQERGERVTQAEPQTAPAVGLVDSLLRWWQSLFQPGWSFATAASLLGVGFFAGYMALAPQSGEPLIVSNGYHQPERANQAHVRDAIPRQMAGVASVQQTVRCVPAETLGHVCYSALDKKQHWFLEEYGRVSAVGAPVEADKITALRIRDDKLLIEYVYAEQFRLALFSVSYANSVSHANNANGSDWSLTKLHEDAIEQGYFDELVLGDSRLSYVKHRAGDNPQRIEIDYDGSD